MRNAHILRRRKKTSRTKSKQRVIKTATRCLQYSQRTFINRIKEQGTTQTNAYDCDFGVAAMVKARKYILKSHFNGLPKATDLELVEEELPELKDEGKYD